MKIFVFFALWLTASAGVMAQTPAEEKKLVFSYPHYEIYVTCSVTRIQGTDTYLVQNKKSTSPIWFDEGDSNRERFLRVEPGGSAIIFAPFLLYGEGTDPSTKETVVVYFSSFHK